MISWRHDLSSLCSSSLCSCLFSPAINVSVTPAHIDHLTTDPGAFRPNTVTISFFFLLRGESVERGCGWGWDITHTPTHTPTSTDPPTTPTHTLSCQRSSKMRSRNVLSLLFSLFCYDFFFLFKLFEGNTFSSAGERSKEAQPFESQVKVQYSAREWRLWKILAKLLHVPVMLAYKQFIISYMNSGRMPIQVIYFRPNTLFGAWRFFYRRKRVAIMITGGCVDIGCMTSPGNHDSEKDREVRMSGRLRIDHHLLYMPNLECDCTHDCSSAGWPWPQLDRLYRVLAPDWFELD